VEEWIEIVQDMITTAAQRHQEEEGQQQQQEEEEKQKLQEYEQFVHVGKALMEQLNASAVQKYIIH
jgi:hypothetical protein